MNNHIFKVLVCALLCGTSVQAALKDSDKVTESDYGCFRLSLRDNVTPAIKLMIKADYEEECKKKNGDITEIITWGDLKDNLPNQILKEIEKADNIEKSAKKEYRSLTPTEMKEFNNHVYKRERLKLMAKKAPEYMDTNYLGRICGF